LEVQRIEVSLDEGRTWLFAARELPEYPIRHGNKIWTWLFWSVEVETADWVKAPGVVVRCTDSTKNVQANELTWNFMGMKRFVVYLQDGDGGEW
jgi:nitrate reductase (NAD(P)H)